uniref:mannosyl-oligosaccharide glucosidase n=1 Tax=Phytophthora ramorum TaxID=164328 RepID=H3GV13_PHYRM
MVLESKVPDGDKDTNDVAPLTFQVQVQLKTQEVVRGVELHYAGLKDLNVLTVKEKLVSLAQRPGGAVNEDLRVDAATFKEYDEEYDEVVLDVLFNEAAASSSADDVKAPIDSLITGKLAGYSQQFGAQVRADLPHTTKLQHVKHVGYVSVFPLLLKVLPPNSPKLLALLKQTTGSNHLWSPFGLRSLSTQDQFYNQEKTPGDNPYCRGAIWMNMNRLALDALHHYTQQGQGKGSQGGAF